MLQLVAIALFCAISVNAELAKVVEAPKAEVNANWWKNAVVYQIYPRSFKDNNDDGVGDIAGILEKLQYLKDTGVTAIWLPPISQSSEPPEADFDYEITNYNVINGKYGDEKQFKQLVQEAHKLGIKILMEMVPNHTSKKHEWFTKSENNDGDFRDFYVWGDSKGADPSVEPPNNWISHLNEPAWEYSPTRKRWYLHQFAKEQPDLNYHSNAVKNEIKKILEFWLALGVDGFVINDAPYLVEKRELTDEKESGIGNPGDYESLKHEYTSNQEETFNIISEWREVIDQYNSKHETEDPRIIITKAHTDLENVKKYCGEGNLKGAHFTYNFLFTEELNRDSNARHISEVIEKWITNVPSVCSSNWVLGGHDVYRVATRFDPKRVDALNTLLAFLPGVMITYNGEEIGQENGNVEFKDGADPIALKAGEEKYKELTRDFERTPFHWDDTTNAGFNQKQKPWLPVSAKYKENNVKKQNLVGVLSHYHTYQDLTKLRQEFGFDDVAVKYKVLADNVLALVKQISEENAYVAIINFGDKEETVDLAQLSEIVKLEKYVKVVLASSNSKKQKRILSTNSLTLEAYESVVVKPLPYKEEGDLDWWKHSVIYQIYPLSFKDYNNDGNGDLKGIISKLEHLKDAGVTAAWLSPIYKSPQVDQGYDISDFTDIDERFGTLDDFDKLVAKAKEMGIKIVLDFVPNHTSDQHEWFLLSQKKTPGYEDFYVWRPGKGITGNKAPNNWLSIFKYSAWEKGTGRSEFYLHQFAKEQPDLNYRNPVVVQKMKDVLKFWLDRGVDGFRMDAVPYIFEDDSFEDEKLSGDENSRPGIDHGSLIHDLTSDRPETFDMIYQWREFVDDYTKEHGGDARILMTEAYTNIENTMKYYGDENGRDGGHFTFNFQLITKLNKDSNARDIQGAIDEWLTHMPDRFVANWVLGNHDQHRVATRFGPENVDGFNMLIAFLPGVMVTYNGEEIGQENGEVTYAEGKDPQARDIDPKEFKKLSRDFERTPFHWDNTVNAGFNKGKKPWLPVSRKHARVNLEEQSKPGKPSHYHTYRDLLKLRKESVLVKGELTINAISEKVLACLRTLEGNDPYVLLFNIGNEIEAVDVKDILSPVTPYLKVLLPSSESYRRVGQLIPSAKLLLHPHESIIATTTNDVITTPKPDEDDDDDDDDDDDEGVGGAAETVISVVTLVIALVCNIFVK